MKKRMIAFLLFVVITCLNLSGQIVAEMPISFLKKHAKNVSAKTKAWNIKVGPIHKEKDDGDVHFGVNTELGFNTVGEIMNAKDEKETSVKYLKEKGSNKDTVVLTGVWRIWCEHSGSEKYVHGKQDIVTTSNPNHIFEIHPITKIDDRNILGTIKRTDGFEYYTAAYAIPKYDDVPFSIRKKGSKVLITTKAAFYNYINMKIKVVDKPVESEDGNGLFVYCQILDDHYEVIAHKRKLVFLKDTEAYNKLKEMKEESVMEVYGMPRWNFSLILWRLENSKNDKSILDWNLPYEIVVTGYEKTEYFED